MGKRILSFQSRLSLEECKKAFRDHIAPNAFSTLSDGYYDFIGSLSGNSFHLRKNIGFLVRDPFRPTCFGTFVNQGDKTTLEISFGVQPWVKYFIYLWRAFVSLLLIEVLVSVFVYPGQSHENIVFMLCLLVGMIFLPTLLEMIFFKNLHRNQEQAMIEFLKRELQCEEM